ncbi:hypothetical protein N9N06_03940 [Aquiluna sp.]|nr:hypothetical protein [Aquiluna sp.]
MHLFNGLGSYSQYLEIYPFHQKLGLEVLPSADLEEKAKKSPYFSVDPGNEEAFPAELDDLIRLHYLVTSRKVTTILEFGVGKSTVVLDDALQANKTQHLEFVSEHLRRTNAFECHSVDNNLSWINVCKESAPTETVTYTHSELNVSTFNDRICTFYELLPNIAPDLIYLDGPDQFSAQGSIRGITTTHPDRLPMVGDLLAMEHFLLPGTLIVVDGRSANARFMKANFQRNWSHEYIAEYDQHFFELLEPPLGVFNKRQIEFCLGDDYFSRL